MPEAEGHRIKGLNTTPLSGAPRGAGEMPGRAASQRERRGGVRHGQVLDVRRGEAWPAVSLRFLKVAKEVKKYTAVPSRRSRTSYEWVSLADTAASPTRGRRRRWPACFSQRVRRPEGDPARPPADRVTQMRAICVASA